MSEPPEERPELAYWKIAIAKLPTDEMRDVAWEFLLRNFAENPRAADTFSAMIMIMQANALYMLSMPEAIYSKALVPLHAATDDFLDDLRIEIVRQRQIGKEIADGIDAVKRGIETAQGATEQLEAAVTTGWRNVNSKELTEKIHAEFEDALYRPLRARCRELEAYTAAAKDASETVEQSIEKFRQIHFGGILLVMVLTTILVIGGAFAYGWKKLSAHYQETLAQALAKVPVTAEKNSEAFRRLNELNATIRVSSVRDSMGRGVSGRYMIVLENAEGLSVAKENKQAAIYFDATRKALTPSK